MASKDTIYSEMIQPRLQEVTWWCREGATMKELADLLEVGERALYRAKEIHPEFREAIRVGKEEADHKIEDSLFVRAQGKVYTETIEEEEEGHRGQKPYKLKRKRTTTREIPPDTNAATFWLKNRQPKKWKDKFEQSSTQKVVILYDLKQPKKKKQESTSEQGVSS